MYGGYNIFFGDLYNAADLVHSDILCAKLAGTFCAGIQVGWFSLGGVQHGPNVDKGCGELGQLDLWMDPKHDPEVAFLRKIATSRASVRDFVTFGRLGQCLQSRTPPFYRKSARGHWWVASSPLAIHRRPLDAVLLSAAFADVRSSNDVIAL